VDQGSYDASALNRYLKGTNFPASKKEVASNAESNGATQELVSQIRDANTERFDSPEEVMQALPAPHDVGRTRMRAGAGALTRRSRGA
jgi:uncharacterized protein DUF2795